MPGNDIERTIYEIQENITALESRLTDVLRPKTPPLPTVPVSEDMTQEKLRKALEAAMVKIQWMEQMIWLLMRRRAAGGMSLIYVLTLPPPREFSSNERENGVYAYWLGHDTGIERFGVPGSGDDQIWVLPPFSPRWYPWNRYTILSGYVWEPVP